MSDQTRRVQIRFRVSEGGFGTGRDPVGYKTEETFTSDRPAERLFLEFLDWLKDRKLAYKNSVKEV